MAPEQVSGEPTDARTDVWGLAATLFEAVTGTKPFPGESVAAVMYAILHKRPELRLVPSPALARLLEKALAKKPSGRPATARALADDLRHLSLGGAQDSTSPMPRRLAVPPSGRVRLAAGMAAAASLLAVLLGALLLPRSTGSSRPGLAASPETPTLLAPPASATAVAARRPPRALPGATPAPTPLPRRPRGEERAAPATRGAEQRPSASAVATGAAAAMETPRREPVVPAPAAATKKVNPKPAGHPPRPHRPAHGRAVSADGAAGDQIPGRRTRRNRAGKRAADRGNRPTALTPAPPAVEAADEDEPLPQAEGAGDRGAEADPDNPTPMLPAALRSVRGTVRLLVGVNDDGNVDSVQILDSSGSEQVDWAIARWVRAKWQYWPAFRQGRQSPAKVVETFIVGEE
jgi:TonB family protein